MSCRRSRRSSESGLTLIETIVTVAILAVGVTGIAASFSASQILSRDGALEAKLAATARWNTDNLRSSAVAYVPCALASAYQTSVYQPPGQIVTVLSPVIFIQTIAGSNNAALQDCGGVPDQKDLGIQQLRIQTTDQATGRSLVRVVLKMWNA